MAHSMKKSIYTNPPFLVKVSGAYFEGYMAWGKQAGNGTSNWTRNWVSLDSIESSLIGASMSDVKNLDNNPCQLLV